MNWELMWAEAFAPNRAGIERSEELVAALAEGWEPFAVSAYGGSVVWLRRQERESLVPDHGHKETK